MTRRSIAAIAFGTAIALSSAVHAQGLTGTLKKISDSGTITIGYRDASPPFSFHDPAGAPTGYSIALCNRIVEAVKTELKRTDIQVKFVAVTPETRIKAVADGTVDIECGSSTHSLSRRELVDFTLMTFVDGASLLATSNSAIDVITDLGGRTVAVAEGTTTERVIAQALSRAGVSATVVKVKDHDAGLAAVEDGKADAYASDRSILIGLAVRARNPNALRLASQFLSYEPYGFMVRRNDADFRLVADRTIAAIYRSGEIGPLFGQWFTTMGGRPSDLLLAMYALNGLPD